MDVAEQMLFANLPGSVDDILRESNVGNNVVVVLHGFFENFLKLQLGFARKLDTLVNAQLAKLKKQKTDHPDVNCLTAARTFLYSMERHAKSMKEKAGVLQDTIIHPLAKLRENGSREFHDSLIEVGHSRRGAHATHTP